jgi:hypothetical protein
MKHMQHPDETYVWNTWNVRSLMPWSDRKFWASTQLPTVNHLGSSKRHMQMWACAPLINSQRLSFSMYSQRMHEPHAPHAAHTERVAARAPMQHWVACNIMIHLSSLQQWGFRYIKNQNHVKMVRMFDTEVMIYS